MVEISVSIFDERLKKKMGKNLNHRRETQMAEAHAG